MVVKMMRMGPTPLRNSRTSVLCNLQAEEGIRELRSLSPELNWGVGAPINTGDEVQSRPDLFAVHPGVDGLQDLLGRLVLDEGNHRKLARIDLVLFLTERVLALARVRLVVLQMS